MAMEPHPVTGVLINSIEVRSGPISEGERRTASLLLADGHPRWVVAAMLGRFPLTLTRSGPAPERSRRAAIGGHLSRADALRDPRQQTMDQLWSDLFGDDPGAGAR
jgi:hypothetical protein